MSHGDVIVASFAKNRRENVRILFSTFKGHDVVDVRVVVGEGPHATATRKGLTIRRELLPELAAALITACQYAGLTVPENAQNAR